jgi:hypothetical protein
MLSHRPQAGAKPVQIASKSGAERLQQVLPMNGRRFLPARRMPLAAAADEEEKCRAPITLRALDLDHRFSGGGLILFAPPLSLKEWRVKVHRHAAAYAQRCRDNLLGQGVS